MTRFVAGDEKWCYLSNNPTRSPQIYGNHAIKG